MKTFITLAGLITGCSSAEIMVQGEPQQPMLSAFWYYDGPPENELVQWVATSTLGGCAQRARWYRGATEATIQFNQDSDGDAYTAALLDLQPDDFWAFSTVLYGASPTGRTGVYASPDDADFTLARRSSGGPIEGLTGDGSFVLKDGGGETLRGEMVVLLRDDQGNLAGDLSLTAGATRCVAAEEAAIAFTAANGG